MQFNHTLLPANGTGGDGMRVYRLKSCGCILAAFGLGMVTAKYMPLAVLLPVTAACMIVFGVVLCRC